MSWIVVAAVLWLLPEASRLQAGDTSLVYNVVSSKTYIVTESGSVATELIPPGPTILASSYGNFEANDISRGTFAFDAPSDIRQNYADCYVASATLVLDLQSTSCLTSAFQEWADCVMPGVSAYHFTPAAGAGMSVVDFWTPMTTFLGQLIPPGERTLGEYTLDVTQAIQDAVDHTDGSDAFGVRLHFANELNGLHIDDNLHMDYGFGPGNARLEVTLARLHNAGGQLKSTALSTPELHKRLSWCSDRRYRVIVELDPNSSAIESDKPFSVELALAGMLADRGIDDRVNRASVDVVEYDLFSLTPKVYDGQQADHRKYVIPSRIFYPGHVYSEVAYDVVAWKLAGPNSALFAVYFDTLKDNSVCVREEYPLIGAGEPFMSSDSYASLTTYSQFSFSDMDGDNLVDILTGGFSETGYIGYLKNIGSSSTPLFAELERFSIGSRSISRHFITRTDNIQPDGLSDPVTWDWDDDGDTDMYTTFNRWYTDDEVYYENVGTPAHPKFMEVPTGPAVPFDKPDAPMAFADLDNDEIFELISLSNSNATVNYRGTVIATYTDVVTRLGGFDLDGDGLKDIVIGFIGGRADYCKNTGIVNNRAHFAPPQPIKSKRGPLEVGGFSTPYAVDWNGDGELDFLSGNEDGTILYFENTGTTAEPNFVEQGPLVADGQVIHFPGEPVQEPHWGYTSLSVLNWDGDSDLDLLVSERTGQINYFENTGSATNPVLTFVDPLKYVSQSVIFPNPRVKPSFYDWNNNGRIDMIMGNLNEQASLYTNASLPGGVLFNQPSVLLDPQGSPVYTERYNGQGRSRYVHIDWNDDGVMDLMIFNHVGDDWPRYFENVGTLFSPQFEEKALPLVKGQHMWVGVGHATCGMAVDWDNDGRDDIVLGGEDGLIRYYNRKFFEEPPAVRRVFFRCRDGLKNIHDARRFADIDRYVERLTLYGDDLVRAQGAGAWQWNPIIVAHHSDLLSRTNPAGTETLVYDPHLEGHYSVHIGIKPVDTADVSVKIRLNGEQQWKTVATTILETYNVSGDISLPRYQVIHCGDFDMTGRTVEVQTVVGPDLQLDFLKFIPLLRPLGAPEMNPVPANCQDVADYLYSAAADFNDDCSVDANDLWMLSEKWLSTKTGYQAAFDFNCDCATDLTDFSAFSLQWLFCNDPAGVGGGGCIATW
jgi:hypothetical protein